MDLYSSIGRIQANLPIARHTLHSLNKCIEHAFDPSAIIQRLQQSSLVGILYQKEDVFKLWFNVTKDKDINIAVSFHRDIMYLVTIFPCDAKRRER